MKLKKLLALLLALALVLTSFSFAVAEPVPVAVYTVKVDGTEVTGSPFEENEPVTLTVAKTEGKVVTGWSLDGSTIAVTATLDGDNYKGSYTVKDEDADDNGIIAFTTMNEGLTTVFVNYYLSEADKTSGKTYIAQTSALVGDPLVEPTKPTPEDGYEFDGWYDGNTKWDFATMTVVNKNYDFIAKFNPQRYQITFDSDGGSTVSSIEADYGSPITKPADPTKDGFVFEAWYDGETKVENFPATMPLGGAAYKAHWTEGPAVTVTFDPDNGEEVITKTGSIGAALTAPTAEEVKKTGYTLTGWTPEVPAKFPATAETYKAVWQKNIYTATFNLNGGTVDGAAGPIKVNVGYGETITAPVPVKDGYTYTWNPALDATMPAEDTEYTAEWTVKKFTVTFKDELAGCDPKTQEVAKDTVEVPNVENGTLLSTILPAWERNGYELLKWTKDGADVDLDTEKVTANATYEPVWSAKKYKLSVLYKDTGTNPGEDKQLVPADTSTTSGLKEYAYGASLAEVKDAMNTALETKNYTKNETTYLFDGWNIELPDTMPAEDLVITSNWLEAIPVTFTMQPSTATFGGFSIKTGANVITDGTVLKVPKGKSLNDCLTAMPTASGGPAGTSVVWQDAEDKPFDPTTAITTATTLYSGWEVVTYTVTFDSDGGSFKPADQVLPGTGTEKAIEPNPAPTKEGYRLLGWYDGLTKFDFTAAVTQNYNLKAHWDNLVWTADAIVLGDTHTVTKEGVTITGDGMASLTITFNDLFQWQKYVGETVGEGETWNVGIRVYAPVGNSLITEATVGGETVIRESAQSNIYYKDVVIPFTMKEITNALAAVDDAKGIITKTAIPAILPYDTTATTTNIIVKIDVSNTKLLNNPEITETKQAEPKDIPYAVVTKDKAVDKVEVTFDPNGGVFTSDSNLTPVDTTQKKKASVYRNDLVFKPEVTYAGYTFEYWETAAGEEFKFDTPITGAITLKAKWTKNWTILGAVNQDGTVDSDKAVKIVGNTITFTDYNEWRNLVDGKLSIKVRFQPYTRRGEHEEITAIIWGDGYPTFAVTPTIATAGALTHTEQLLGGPNPDYDQEFIIAMANLTAKIGADGMLDLDTATEGYQTKAEQTVTITDATGNTSTFKVIFDFANIDMVNLKLEKGTEHQLVIENGKKQLVTVTYNPDNGSEKFEQEPYVKYNYAKKPIPDPTKDGYAFVAWNDKDGKAYGFNTSLTEDIELTADWAVTWEAEADDATGALVAKANDKGVIKVNKADLWAQIGDKDGADDWMVAVKFTAPEAMDDAVLYLDGVEDPSAVKSGKTITTEIHFTRTEVEQWNALDGHVKEFTYVVRNNADDETGTTFTLVLDTSNLTLLDSKNDAGSKNVIVIEGGIIQDWTVTFDTDTAAGTLPPVTVVKGNWVPVKPLPEKSDKHYTALGWYTVNQETGALAVAKYAFTDIEVQNADNAKAADRTLKLMPKWNHDAWDVEEANVPATYDAKNRILTFNNFTVNWVDDKDGYLVAWSFVAPDSLSKLYDQTHEEWRLPNPDAEPPESPLVDIATQRVQVPNDNKWYELALKVEPTLNASNNYIVKGKYTITEEDMKARIVSGKPLELTYKFGTNGHLTDAVVIKVIIEPKNIVFKKDGKEQTIIKNGEEVYMVTFDPGNDDDDTIVYVPVGEKVEKPAEDPVKEGKKFVAWTLDGEPFDFDVAPTEHITLVATYVDAWTVSFDYQNGTQKVDVTVKDGDLVAEPEAPVRQGYTFLGWIDLDAPEDADYFDFDTPITKDVYLQADYKKNETVIQNGYSAAFQDDLKMVFYYTLTKELADDATATATLKGDGFVDETKAIVGDGISKNDNYYVATVPIKYFQKPITVKLFKGEDQVDVLDKDGVTDDTTFTKSLADYVEDIQASETMSDNMKALAEMLKWYGLAAENKFLSGTNDLSDMPYVAVDIKDDEVVIYDDKAALAGMGIEDVFCTVQFQEANKLNVIFAPADGAELKDYTFTVDGKDVTSEVQVVGSEWYVSVSKIFAKKLSDDHIFTISDGTTTYTVKTSVVRYAKTIIKKNVGGEAMVNLAKAMILYNDAAKTYFANK